MASAADLLPPALYTPRLRLVLYDRSAAQSACILAVLNSPTAYAGMGDAGLRTAADFQAARMKSRLQSEHFAGGKADIDCTYVLQLRDALNNSSECSQGDNSAEYIGIVVITQSRAGERLFPPDMGWALREECRGKGYATEAAREMLRMAREQLQLKNVVVFFSRHNPASNRVAARVGFEPSGQVWDERKQKWKQMWTMPGTMKDARDALEQEGLKWRQSEAD